MSVLTLTIDLGAANPAGKSTDHPGSPSPQHNGWLAPRDAVRHLGALELGRTHVAAGADAHEGSPTARALPAGRAGLSAQMSGAGWGAMHADRLALLQSVRNAARQWT